MRDVQPSQTYEYFQGLLAEHGTSVDPESGPVLDVFGGTPVFRTTHLAGYDIDFNDGGRGRLVVRGIEEVTPEDVALGEDPLRREEFNERRRRGVLADAAWDIRSRRGLDIGRASLLEAHGPMGSVSHWDNDGLIIGRRAVSAALQELRLPVAEEATFRIMNLDTQIAAIPYSEPSRLRMLLPGSQH